MLINAILLTTILGLTHVTTGAPNQRGQNCGRRKGWCPPGELCIPKQPWCADLTRCNGRCVPNPDPLPFPFPIPLPPQILPWTPLPLRPTPLPLTPLPEPLETVLPGPLIIPDDPFTWDDFPFSWDPLSTGEPIIDSSPVPFPVGTTTFDDSTPTGEPTILVNTDITAEETSLISSTPTPTTLIDTISIALPLPPLPTLSIDPSLLPTESTVSEELPSSADVFPEGPFPTAVDTPRNDYPSCSGFQAGPSDCPDDSYCADDPRDPDIFNCGLACKESSICIPIDAPICGGFAGLACPEGLLCYDAPNDDCDPEQGWSDCFGVCL